MECVYAHCSCTVCEFDRGFWVPRYIDIVCMLTLPTTNAYLCEERYRGLC